LIFPRDEQPSEADLTPLSRRAHERLAYLEGWVAGAQYATEYPIEQTAELANTLNQERLALCRELFG
jgi:hypothetical protein